MLFYRRIPLVLSKRLYCSSMMTETSVSNLPHVPVLVNEVLDYLKPEENQTIIDMTFGAGGHSKKILEKCNNIKLIALDRDPLALEYAYKLRDRYSTQILPLLGKFSDLPQLLKEHHIKPNSIDGILFDYGCSSMQFDIAERGFSISKNAYLDMRMDGNRCPDMPTAADVLAKSTEEDLYRIIKIYGDEKQARKIARAIIESRYLFKKLNTTQELAKLVDSIYENDVRVDKLQRKTSNATKTFQALRIFVNNELNEINYGLILARHFLKIGGRLLTITFHSLEDTIVKRHIHGNLIENTINPLPLKYSSHSLSVEKGIVQDLMETNWKPLHKHVIIPKYEEIEENPRSRSAKFRAAIKIK